MSNKNEEPVTEITKVKFSPDMCQVEYTLDAFPFTASGEMDELTNEFIDSMCALPEHAIAIKELPKGADKPYRCNALSLSHRQSDQGINRKAVISCTKVTATGKADNISTPQVLYQAANTDADVVPEKAAFAIKEVVRQAKLFILGNRRLKKIYCQLELAA